MTKISYIALYALLYYFFPRPRRFGKTLFVDTLNTIFQGRKALFRGLYIHDRYDWENYPVINISFAGGVVQDRQSLDEKINNKLRRIADKFGVVLTFNNISDRFHELIELLSRKFKKKVVILIDEYDKPLLDNISDTAIALEMREGLILTAWSG